MGILMNPGVPNLETKYMIWSERATVMQNPWLLVPRFFFFFPDWLCDLGQVVDSL